MFPPDKTMPLKWVKSELQAESTAKSGIKRMQIVPLRFPIKDTVKEN